MVKIFHHFIIKAPIAKVYDSVSTINGLKNWWTTDTTGTTEKGGEIRFGFGKDYDLMKVTVKETSKLVGWEVIESSFPDGIQWVGTNISFSLSEDANKNTVVKFQHSNWKEATDFYGGCNFHWGIFMVSLKSLCETGKGNPQEVQSADNR